MPSFDAVSEVDFQEIDNAVNQAKKEIEHRYDFKGSKTDIVLEEKALKISTDDDYKLGAVKDILISKAVKRGIDPSSLKFSDPIAGSGMSVKCNVEILHGIPQDLAKKLIKLVKDQKLKVQAQIMDDKIRVTGKKKDELQEVMACLKSNSFGLPLQFNNFKD